MDSSASPAAPEQDPGGSWGPWLAPRVRVSPTGGTTKWQVSQEMATGQQSFRWTLRHSGIQSSEAEKEAEFLPPKSLRSRKHMRWACGVHGIPCLQKGCMSLPPGGTPKQKEVPHRMERGHQAFRGILRQPKEESSEAKQEAGVIPQRPVCFPQPLHQARRVLGSLPCTQGVCLCQVGHLKVARSPPMDGDRTLGFQGNVEVAQK